jgi:pterin-4a-carbinolamine dehydratase
MSLWKHQDDGANNERETNVGSMKTIGEGAERPGIGSNHTPTIRSLHNPVQNNIHTNRIKRLTETDIDGSYEGRPM